VDPLDFREIALVGCNAFGIEELDGRRQHAIHWYFELVRRHGIDLSPLLPRHFPLSEYRRALLATRKQERSGAVKVVFDFRG
jgi:threonine dehydrogenase-like Zn-dependent dehydrogenase